jgi:hypothetical protein
MCVYMRVCIYTCVCVCVCVFVGPSGQRRGCAAARLLGIAGSNPAGGTDICLVCIVCFQAEVSARGRSLVQRSPTDRGVLLCVISKPQE